VESNEKSSLAKAVLLNQGSIDSQPTRRERGGLAFQPILNTGNRERPLLQLEIRAD
jgi:hypothetical protein